jgi:hypothetical protein
MSERVCCLLKRMKDLCCRANGWCVEVIKYIDAVRRVVWMLVDVIAAGMLYERDMYQQ